MNNQEQDKKKRKIIAIRMKLHEALQIYGDKKEGEETFTIYLLGQQIKAAIKTVEAAQEIIEQNMEFIKENDLAIDDLCKQPYKNTIANT